MRSELRLDDYQARALRSDRTASKRNLGVDLPVLGLVGEIGSLLSEAKKKQRDARSYLGYEENVVEEMGDALWYLATIGAHAGISLSSLRRRHLRDADECTFGNLQPQHVLPLAAPTVAFERTLLRLVGAVGRLADACSGAIAPTELDVLLADILDLMIEAANESGISLEEAARKNLEKAEDRWPTQRSMPLLFDESFPLEEQLPRELEVDVFERSANGKLYVVQRCNGIFIGDRLTDNIMKPDDYRFHDAFHYAYAAVLGWSPVVRALFRQKRKSEMRVDEGEDSARAILIEEGVATYVFPSQAPRVLQRAETWGSRLLLPEVRQAFRGRLRGRSLPTLVVGGGHPGRERGVPIPTAAPGWSAEARSGDAFPRDWSDADMTPEHFLDAVSRLRFRDAFNPYSDACESHDVPDGPAIRRRNLRLVLEAALAHPVVDVWVARDLGYRGGRRTGLALTDEAHLTAHASLYGCLPLAKATLGPIMAERTAKVVWGALGEVARPVFLWNVFPLHPHSPGDPLSNRNHTRGEREGSAFLLRWLVGALRPTTVVAIGRDAAAACAENYVEAVAVRHPSYGGQREFLDGIGTAYGLPERQVRHVQSTLFDPEVTGSDDAARG